MAREDRILSQSEIDSLLRKIAPKSDEPAAKEEPSPVEPVELEVKPAKAAVEPEAASSGTPQDLKTVSFKSIEITEDEEPTRAGDLETDSIKLSEYKPKTAEPPASVQPMETARQKSALGEADDLKTKVAELTAEVNKLSTALQTVAQLEEKIRQLETLMKNAPESAGTLKARIDKIAAELEAGEGKKSDYGFLEAFRCSHCRSKGNVAIYIKCTSCGKENWMGWWPEEEEK
ncbi:MAG: hypothetical protein JXA17_09095 [Dehalococcoidales bacterium]|nr:hypothetical protein [Dehalococcoidales bacterium]